MSFPSAIENMKQGMSPDEALFGAMQTDTRLGFIAVTAISEAAEQQLDDPMAHVQTRLREVGGDEAAKSVLRGFRRGEGVKVDLDPDSVVGRQAARLMTDGARDLFDKMYDMRFGFANCCGIIASKRSEDVKFTVGEQIKWQHSIDC